MQCALALFIVYLHYNFTANYMNAKKVLLSGIKPTGRPHIGNYFGAMKQFVDLTTNDDYDTFVMIADLHSLTSVHNGDELRSLTYNLLLDYLAVGLDPKKVTFFRQSHVPAHTELAWILGTLTTMPFLMRAHAFKDAEAKNKEISVGTFTYPVLMAADILLYNADIVPVGSDQKQHVEITRDLALKFNSTYQEVFKLPEAYIKESVATVPGTDGQKMSKSYKNTIPLFGTPAEVERAVMSIVTDSGGDIPKNVYAIHSLLRSQAGLDALYAQHKGKYKALKDALLADILALIEPFRERRAYYESQHELVKEVLQKGESHAQKTALQTLSRVRSVIGVE